MACIAPTGSSSLVAGRYGSPPVSLPWQDSDVIIAKLYSCVQSHDAYPAMASLLRCSITIGRLVSLLSASALCTEPWSLVGTAVRILERIRLDCPVGHPERRCALLLSLRAGPSRGFDAAAVRLAFSLAAAADVLTQRKCPNPGWLGLVQSHANRRSCRPSACLGRVSFQRSRSIGAGP